MPLLCSRPVPLSHQYRPIALSSKARRRWLRGQHLCGIFSILTSATKVLRHILFYPHYFKTRTVRPSLVLQRHHPINSCDVRMGSDPAVRCRSARRNKRISFKTARTPPTELLPLFAPHSPNPSEAARRESQNHFFLSEELISRKPGPLLLLVLLLLLLRVTPASSLSL
jgi:hypothetical protein